MASVPGSGTLLASGVIRKATSCPLYIPCPTIWPASLIPVAFRLLQPLPAGIRLRSVLIVPSL
jgi:hypothetical protein